MYALWKHTDTNKWYRLTCCLKYAKSRQTFPSTNANFVAFSDLPRLSLSDTASPNHVLETLDVDASGLTRFAFSEPCEHLRLDFATGTVRLRKSLPLASDDYTLNCSVTVESASTGAENLTLQLIAKVSAESAKHIRFAKELYNATVREGAPSGTVVVSSDDPMKPLLVEADAKALDSALKYRILSPREMFFTVDSVSGMVRNSNPMDYDKVSSNGRKVGRRGRFVQASID